MYIIPEKHDQPVFITAYVEDYSAIAHLLRIRKMANDLMRA
ncbi:MAG: hypothetical protein K0Q79_1616 [Flavipsychrobacter sp.]|nr:hypothetical protein [Flavipsychrobacter sp.]